MNEKPKTIDELIKIMDGLHADCAAAGNACHFTIARNDLREDGGRGVHSAGRAGSEEEIRIMLMTTLTDHIHVAKKLGFSIIGEQLLAIRAMFTVLWNLDSSTITERERIIETERPASG